MWTPCKCKLHACTEKISHKSGGSTNIRHEFVCKCCFLSAFRRLMTQTDARRELLRQLRLVTHSEALPCPSSRSFDFLQLRWLSGGYEGILSELFYIENMLPFQWVQLKSSSFSLVGPWFCLFIIGGLHELSICSCMCCFSWDSCIVSLHVYCCNKLKWPLFELFAPSPLLRVRIWLNPFKGHFEPKAIR